MQGIETLVIPEQDLSYVDLEVALEERDEARRRFDAAIGTSAEMGAYMRLRTAQRKVSAEEKRLHRD